MTPAEHEDMTLKHNQILMGVNDKNGIVDRVEELYIWLQRNHGKSSVWSNIKDIALASGILGFIIKFLILK